MLEKGLILVGAGPGDPDLLTIKGMKAIEKAEVILYDALVNEELLSYASPTCKKIFVGKRAGTHYMAQHAINSLILKYATSNRVVRLKGGDPFVFGRGMEEIEIAHQHNIDFEVIPGITSAISGPASVGIPVTTRNVSRSFWVVTATSSDSSLNDDLHLACQSTATIIILMGIKKMDSILDEVRKGRGSAEPVAIIQNATRSDQNCVIGTAADIKKKFEKAKTSGPGIIVVGKVIEESKSAGILVEKVKERLIAA